MSYPVDLDEIRTDRLVAELARRAAALKQRICPYCGNCQKFTFVSPASHRHRIAGVCDENCTARVDIGGGVKWDPRFPHVGGKRVPLPSNRQSCKMYEMHRAYNEGTVPELTPELLDVL